MELDAGRRLGRYEIIGMLGKGGMGQVYRARDLRLGREVAVKVLPERLASDPDRLQRFEREARAASLVNHPNLLVIYDIGNADGVPFLVTELLEGESLRRAIAHGGAFDVPRSVFCATGIARGLAAAHDKGIIHRDLKPENVYLLHDGRLKILDFGLAKVRAELGPSVAEQDTSTEQRLTATGMLMGTVGYMSPEQAAELEVDFRADQFALGVVLYEVLTGRRPFQRPTLVQTLAAVIEADPAPVSSQGPELPAELVALVERLLAKQPEQRYTSTHDLVRELETIAESQGVLTSLPALSRGQDAGTTSSGHPSGARQCPRCSRRNDAASRFCNRCGLALSPPSGSRSCPSCGHQARTSSSFCGRCGHRLSGDVSGHPPASATLLISTPSTRTSSSDPLPPGERRQVTVGTSFLGGYGDLVEYLPPAEVEEVTDRLRDLAAEVVDRHGGVIHKLTGEEMVVLFGVPVAHEDDFVRAVRAFRELHDRVEVFGAELAARTGQRLALHSGIDTGWVVTRLLDGAERFSVTGGALKSAATLGDKADAGEILVGPETRRLIAPFFETEAGEKFFVKGRSRPIVPHRVVGESGRRGRLSAAPGERLTPFAGRERELESLREALGKARRGEGQVAVVTGEAGAGKSRLVYELTRAFDAQGVRLLQGRCQASEPPYLPFVEALRESLGGVEPNEPAADVASRILAVDPDLEHLVPFYLHLLGISSDEHPLPEQFAGRQLDLVLADTLAVIFTACAQQGPRNGEEHRPVVLLLEDWHHADEGSRTVLRQLQEMVPAHPLLVVVTHRSEHTVEWAAAPQASIRLGALPAESSAAVLAAVAGVARFPPELAELLHERTGGNPFFLEETCRAMLETGGLEVAGRRARLRGSIEDLELPATVQAVIRTRLDQLDPEMREVLRRASVIGRELSGSLLERTASDPAGLPRALEALRGLGIIQQTRVLPEPAYRFKNALTRDVAYESLLQHQRRSLHRLVGEALEELDGEAAADRLAYHFSRARSWDKAVRYGRRAARQARRLSRFADALRDLEEVQKWLLYWPESPERKQELIDVLLEQERLCETLGHPDRQQRTLDDLTVLLDPEKDRAEMTEVYRRQGELATIRERYFDAQLALSEALRIAREIGDEVGERNSWRSIGFLRWHQDRPAEALEANRAALDIDRRRDDFAAVAIDLMNIGSGERRLGEHDKAEEHLREALEIFEKLEDTNRIIDTIQLLGTNYRDRGDNAKAVAELERAKELSRKTQSTIQLFHQLIVLGNSYIELGRFEEALECYREAAESCRKARYAHGLSRSLLALGEALVVLERHAEALGVFVEAAETFEQLAERETAASAWGKAAACCASLGDAARALDSWRRVHALRHAVHDTEGELEAFEGMARASRAPDGDNATAARYFASALELARQLHDGRKEGELLNTLGILEWSRGAYEEALKRYSAALQVFRDLGDEVHSGLILNSMGVTLSKLGWYEEAVAHLEEAREVNRKTGERLLLSHSLAALGEIHYDRQDAERARRHFEESLALRREVGDRRGEGWMQYQLARVHAAGRPEQAAELLGAALAAAEESGDGKLDAACRRLRTEIG